jgi:hypothetical protein
MSTEAGHIEIFLIPLAIVSILVWLFARLFLDSGERRIGRSRGHELRAKSAELERLKRS